MSSHEAGVKRDACHQGTPLLLSPSLLHQLAPWVLRASPQTFSDTNPRLDVGLRSPPLFGGAH